MKALTVLNYRAISSDVYVKPIGFSVFVARVKNQTLEILFWGQERMMVWERLPVEIESLGSIAKAEIALIAGCPNREPVDGLPMGFLTAEEVVSLASP